VDERSRCTPTRAPCRWPHPSKIITEMPVRVRLECCVWRRRTYTAPIGAQAPPPRRAMLQMRYAKVIFICQSLGGIVARQYLLHVKNRYGHTVLGHFRPLGRIEVGQGFPKHSSAQTKRHLDRGSRRTPPSSCENADALVQLFSGSIDLRRPVADPCVREEASVTPAPSIWPIHSPDHRLATSRKCDRG
jgi:hypothetical protein